MKQFLKDNKWKLFIGTLATLMPMVVGLLLWNRLPDTMATHWGADGVVDGSSGKAFVVFGLNLILCAFYWLGLLATAADKGNRKQTPKAMGILFWIIPALGWMVNGFMYSAALGKTWGFEIVMPILFGVMFLVIGNQLPKIRQNRTLGIKVSWTLNNEENWNKTHRFGGKVWVACGALTLLCVFLPGKVMIFATMILTLVAVVVPVIYSYSVYKAHCKAGTEYQEKPKSKTEVAATKGTFGFVVVLLIAIAALMFTGDVTTSLDENALTVDSTYYQQLTVELETIESVEHREHWEPGMRISGFGSVKLSLGLFENEEFGLYTRYCYNSTESCIVIVCESKTLVINGKDEAQTKDIYDSLLKAIQ